MRAARLRLLTPLVVVGGLVGAPARTARAETLDDFAVVLGELNARVKLWLRLADRLPQQDIVDRYLLQKTKEDFKRKDPKPVQAEDVLAIVVTPGRDLFNVRKAAANALKEAATKDADPDLEARTGGSTSKRGRFALDNVIKHINDKKGETVTRQLVHEILQIWFGTGKGKNQSAIFNFKADDEKTWGPAAAAWREVARDS